MNKFGHSSTPAKRTTVIRAPDVIVFTKDGDYNIRDHRLCNVKTPTEATDASTKNYVDVTAEQLRETMKEHIGTLNTSLSSLGDKSGIMELRLEDKIDKTQKQINTTHQSLKRQLSSSIDNITATLKTHTENIAKDSLKSVTDDLKQTKEKLIQVENMIGTEFDVTKEFLKSYTSILMEDYSKKFKIEIADIKGDLANIKTVK